MKNGMLILVAVMLALPAIAQKGKGKMAMTAEQRAEKITNRMVEKTAATAEQKTKLHDINLASEKQRDTDRATNAGNKEALKAARKKRNGERDTKLKEVLSPEQWTKWEAHKKEVRDAHKAKKQEIKAEKNKLDDEIEEIGD